MNREFNPGSLVLCALVYKARGIFLFVSIIAIINLVDNENISLEEKLFR